MCVPSVIWSMETAAGCSRQRQQHEGPAITVRQQGTWQGPQQPPYGLWPVIALHAEPVPP